MLIMKILNNNLVLSRDEQGREVIVKGCGVAFQKKRGQEIDESVIEKIFVPENQQNSRQMQEFLLSIPSEYLDFVQRYVDDVKEKQGLNLGDSIYLALSDHLMGTIQRFRDGISLQNLLLLDIRRLYKKEYSIGLDMLHAVTQKFHVELPVDEAGFIALHFVNAQGNRGENDGYQISTLVKQILEIVENYYEMEFQEDNIYYQRFLTHLKYFAQRFLHKELHYDEDTKLFDIVKEQYRESYGCVKLIYIMMEEKYQYQLTEEEMLYLIIHIQKITERE